MFHHSLCPCVVGTTGGLLGGKRLGYNSPSSPMSTQFWNILGHFFNNGKNRVASTLIG